MLIFRPWTFISLSQDFRLSARARFLKLPDDFGAPPQPILVTKNITSTSHSKHDQVVCIMALYHLAEDKSSETTISKESKSVVESNKL